MAKKFMVLAHRGYRGKFTENTLLSFQKGFEFGADGVEFDVQKTKDGQYVIMHDNSLKRIGNMDKNVEELTLAEVKMVDLPMGQKIPTLEETLSLIPKDKFVNIELKEETITTDDLENIYNLAVKYISLENLLLSSFNHDLLPFFRKKKVKIGMLIGERDNKNGILNLFAKIYRMNPEFVNPPIKIYELMGKRIADILVWLMKFPNRKIAYYTVNTQQQFDSAKTHADVVFSDEVEYALKYRNSIV